MSIAYQHIRTESLDLFVQRVETRFNFRPGLGSPIDGEGFARPHQARCMLLALVRRCSDLLSLTLRTTQVNTHA